MIIEYSHGIKRDPDVHGSNVYYGTGQGCGTIWLKSVAEAKAFIAKNGYISGENSGQCNKCGCHYSYGSKEWGKYPEFACREWKERIKTVRED